MLRRRRLRNLFPLFFLVIAAASIRLPGQEASVKEESISFKTYPFSDPDPAPLFGPIYPYFRFDGYSVEGRPQEWKMVRLENPYVKVLVCPEIGGKVWGAVEKSANREFIYLNPVVKFREIALRGPWTSGGIELNFGTIGHAPTTATPVDYIIQENGDGSVSCVVGAIDLPSRTAWRVNIRLPKDAACVETECFWYNPTSFHDSLYNWLTSAEDVGDDLRYYYPGTRYIGHGGDAHPWPVGENGRDVSYYRNNDFGGSKSYHILGEYGESFGGYYERSGFGYGHWALYDDKPGMKLWVWSLARDGAIWEDLLTDRPKGQYTEPQTGLLYNQAASDSGLTPFKHMAFGPQSVMRWKEIWFPLKDIGGLVAASPHAALNVERSGGRIKVGICPLRPIDDDLVIRLGREKIFERRLRLKPMETFVETLEAGDREGEVVLALGREKLRWSSGDRDRNRLSRPLAAPEGFRWTSAEGLFVAGEELLKQRSSGEALAKFLACLEIEPGHVRARTRAAELYVRRAEYPEALDQARKALAVDATDAGANFVYGTINRELGRLADAKDGFGWAARSLEFRSAAYEQLAEVSIGEKKFERAAEYARRSLDYNAYNMNARWLRAVLFRLGGEAAAAEAELDEILRLDPLSHSARFEKSRLEPGELSRRNLTSLVRSELPHETYLELALSYCRLGLNTEAIEVLSLAPSHPLIDLWLAYLWREDDAAKSRTHLLSAAAASPYLVFPHRREDIPVLRWAAADGGDWKASYYLALVLWNVGQKEDAGKILRQLADSPDWGPFYLTRARLLESEGTEGRLADIRKAIRLDEEDWRAWRAQTALLNSAGNNEEALRSARTIYEKRPDKPALAMDFAKALLETGRTRECLRVLEKTTILPYEGAWEGRELYRRANLFLAAAALKRGDVKAASAAAEKARLWPENLGAGKPFDVDERLEDFVRAAGAEKAGERKKAEALYSSVCSATEKFRSSWDSLHLLGALALKKTGRQEEADRLLADWRAARGEADPVFSWAEAKYQGDEKRADDVLARLRSATAGTNWDTGAGDRYFSLVREILSAESKKK